jgi:hypothetical protein
LTVARSERAATSAAGLRRGVSSLPPVTDVHIIPTG